ncbi:MAG TPA: hypothetical protein VFH17_07410, partial [Coriobacteriia bacterium]|nr:hypothetical protein [Coriobacteriia bacterium]
MLKRLVILAVSCALLPGIAGCMPDRGGSTSRERGRASPADERKADVHRVQYVWNALEAQGLQVRQSTTSADSIFFGNDARHVALKADEATVQLYIPSGTHTTSELAARIASGGSSYRSPDGTEVFVSWAGHPRFYRDSNLIAFYLVGQDLVDGDLILTRFRGQPSI